LFLSPDLSLKSKYIGCVFKCVSKVLPVCKSPWTLREPDKIATFHSGQKCCVMVFHICCFSLWQKNRPAKPSVLLPVLRHMRDSVPPAPVV